MDSIKKSPSRYNYLLAECRYVRLVQLSRLINVSCILEILFGGHYIAGRKENIKLNLKIEANNLRKKNFWCLFYCSERSENIHVYVCKGYCPRRSDLISYFM